MKDYKEREGANPPGQTGRPMLLVVMADPVRTTVAKYLRSCGMEVTETRSADEALKPSCSTRRC